MGRRTGPWGGQWKGTDVCIDLTCPDCKGQTHYDGDFLYAWKCPYCGSEWEMPQHIEMYRKVEGHPMCEHPEKFPE